MRTEKFKNIFWFAPKSNIKAGDGLDKGRFPFYTSSPKLTKWIDKEQHFDEALIFGTGGLASVHFEDQPFSTSTDCIVAITTNKEIKTKFVYYYLFGNIHLLERGFKGAGLKHISKKYIENLNIPILPIETQNKIVAVLDKASALVSKREQTIQLLDELLKATFLETFGDLFSNEKKWSLEFIGKLCDVQGGLQITPKRNSNPIEMPYLRVANVFRGRLDLNEIKNIKVTENEIERILLQAGDILIVEGHGNINEIGRASLWNGEIERILHQNHLIRLRVSSNKVNSIFLTEYLNSYSGIYQMKNISNTTSGLNTISTGKVKSIKIPTPPIEIQNKFELFYKNVKEEKAKIILSQTYLSAFFKSILQKVFNGQLSFNIDIELDALVKEIDIQKKENDLSKIVTDFAYLQRLIDKMNSQEFKERELYDKAKHAIFQLLKEDNKITQEYDEKSKSLKLSMK
jgi:type I restriction enzyme S subunit